MSNYAGWETFDPNLRKATQAVQKRSKYNAQPTEVDGHRFASQREAQRYAQLKALLAAGTISGLELQPQYPLHAITQAGVKACVGRYIADFRYMQDAQQVVEDAKGMRTELYKWKKKHAELEYGIGIVEV